MEKLLSVSLRIQRVWVPEGAVINKEETLSKATGILIAELKQLGFGVSESLLHVLNNTTPAFQRLLLEKLRDVMGVKKNWTPLIKGWDQSTGESLGDQVLTFFTNLFQVNTGVKLQCGHTIPHDTFPLERYNGCPFCKTLFATGEIEKFGQGSKLKVLELWTAADAEAFLLDLLQSKTALDASQVESLKTLLYIFPYPKVKPAIKETTMVVIDALSEWGEPQSVQEFFQSPTDIMRFLWYKHTGLLQIVEPAVLLKRAAKAHTHMRKSRDKSAMAKHAEKAKLKLKYSRRQGRMAAIWLNNLELDAEKICKQMHPKRAMWVRFIRALRLAEYSKVKGFEKLHEVMDRFYNQQYTVWQGEVNASRMKFDQKKTFALLQQRPGLFARSLFANMLWFGAKDTIAAFEQVADKIPARLMFTLSMYADIYFTAGGERVVKAIAGNTKRVPTNPLLKLYHPSQLEEMIQGTKSLCLETIKGRFAAMPNKAKTMFIDKELYSIPVSIADRSETVHDIAAALQGTKFNVEGSKIRLFMQWGVGLPAQHLDMDLSCQVIYDVSVTPCNYYQRKIPGCQHSGDVISIPEKTGAAEYIEIDIDVLRKRRAKYVAFTCNAYSNGTISPNLVIGWMNSKYPMDISNATGVAYDPGCVQHQVRITQSLSKGLVFGVLDVESNAVIWLEMPYDGQTVGSLDYRAIETMLRRLKNKITIGQVLSLKAAAQNIQIVDVPEADELYTIDWARNTAAVTQLLPD